MLIFEGIEALNLTFSSHMALRQGISVSLITDYFYLKKEIEIWRQNVTFLIWWCMNELSPWSIPFLSKFTHLYILFQWYNIKSMFIVCQNISF